MPFLPPPMLARYAAAPLSRSHMLTTAGSNRTVVPSRTLGNEPNLLQRYTVFSETFSNAASSSAVSNSRRSSSSFSVAIRSCSILTIFRRGQLFPYRFGLYDATIHIAAWEIHFCLTEHFQGRSIGSGRVSIG